MSVLHLQRRIHPTVPNILEHAYASILIVRNALKEGLDFVLHMGVGDAVHIQVVIRELGTTDFVPHTVEDEDSRLKVVINQQLGVRLSAQLTVEEGGVRWKTVTNAHNQEQSFVLNMEVEKDAQKMDVQRLQEESRTYACFIDKR